MSTVEQGYASSIAFVGWQLRLNQKGGNDGFEIVLRPRRTGWAAQCLVTAHDGQVKQHRQIIGLLLVAHQAFELLIKQLGARLVNFMQHASHLRVASAHASHRQLKAHILKLIAAMGQGLVQQMLHVRCRIVGHMALNAQVTLHLLVFPTL